MCILFVLVFFSVDVYIYIHTSCFRIRWHVFMHNSHESMFAQSPPGFFGSLLVSRSSTGFKLVDSVGITTPEVVKKELLEGASLREGVEHGSLF